MIPLKRLSPAAVEPALEKAQCYRFLNEPAEAESICRDILEVEPNHQQGLILLLLSLTDQFETHLARAFSQARELLPQLSDEYCRHYYEGLICERRAKAHLRQAVPGDAQLAHEWLEKAMNAYTKAMDLRIAGNDDTILRWNTCARIINRLPESSRSQEVLGGDMLE
jgi:hypothetical protein